MKNFQFNYGKEKIDFSLDEKNIVEELEGTPVDNSKTEEEIVKQALQNPIGSKKLQNLIHKGETVCLVISDITRAWQRPHVFLPIIIEELNNAGIADSDITILSANGSHRKQTLEEHEILLGKDLAKRFTVIDHDSKDKNNFDYLGDTSYKTPVLINKIAMECDHIVLTGAIVYHLLAGFSAGRKSILPGIASYETIMKNHALSLSETLGQGKNSLATGGKLENNPVHLDMMEAASFVKPTFLLNVVMNSEGKIGACVSGDYIKAHEEGCKVVEKNDGVFIKQKADLAIGTAGGYPKDINFYQSIKSLLNEKEAIKLGGTIILASECSEGLGGNDDIVHMLLDFDNMLDREIELRENYSIAKDVAFMTCDAASKHDVIFISKIDENLVKKANVHVVKTMEEALAIAYKKHGKDLKISVMPHAANTFPIFER
ncbi:MAG: nickel-dependent lactate racemase [Clostridiaceae bacterium]